jgi:DNA-binding response OmpR family regulator
MRHVAYIMVLDDDKDFADAAATVLRSAGYEVEVQFEIRPAMESIQRSRPDLLLLDVMFPEDRTAGFSLARAMQHYNDKLRDIPILVLSAVNRGMCLGFGNRNIYDRSLPVSEFIGKPVDFGVLQRRIAALLKRAASGKESKTTGRG